MRVSRHQDSVVRMAMHGRILRCPVGDNPTDCPLHEIRLLPIEERLKWLDSKTDFELTELFGYHIRCLEHKEKSGIGTRKSMVK